MLKPFTKLRRLTLDSLSLTGGGIANITGLTSLTSISFFYSTGLHHGACHLSALTNLNSLSPSGNAESTISFLESLSTLTGLTPSRPKPFSNSLLHHHLPLIHSSPKTWPEADSAVRTPSQWEVIRALSSLTAIDFAENTNSIPVDIFSHLENLTDLSLDSNRISMTDFRFSPGSQTDRLKYLSPLALASNHLKIFIPSNISKFCIWTDVPCNGLMIGDS